ncbi:MAG: cytidylyltransferase domain-containing protein [Fibrobacterota bacterium]
MEKQTYTCALIPARGGSKGVPGKNIRPFLGEPLIVHSIRQAAEAVDDVWVSTDDEKIARISRGAGAKIISRPRDISTDTATTESAVAHALDEIARLKQPVDRVVLLQATSPLRPKGAVSNALARFEQTRCDSLLSISPTHRFFWRIDGDRAVAEYDFLNRPRRQDMTADDIRYVENGSLYIFTRQSFAAHSNRLGGEIGYVIFDEVYSMEIDTETDFALLEKTAREHRLL